MLPSNLAQKWRELAAQEKMLGADAQAKTLEWCAAELEQAQREWELPGTPTEARCACVAPQRYGMEEEPSHGSSVRWGGG